MTYSVWGSFGTNTPTRDVFATETFTTLRALTPPPSTLNTSIEVDGGVAKGDGLGGIFYYDPVSVLADDAVNVIAPTPIPAAGRWRRLLINVGFAVVTGGIVFGAGNVLAQDAANFFWDNVNKRFGIGNAAPTVALDITGSLKTSLSVITSLIGTDTDTRLNAKIGGVNRWLFGASGDGYAITPNVDNTYDIGQSAVQVRTGYFKTSVVTPLVGNVADTTLNFQVNNAAKWGIATSAGVGGAAAYTLFPSGDATQDIGGPVTRIRTAYAAAIDSGTTGSLSLRTNNGSPQFVVDHTAGTIANTLHVTGGASGNSPFLQAIGDANTGMRLIASGTGTIVFEAPGGNTQFSVLGTASATRNITVTGSNGGNPVLNTTAGGVDISPATVRFPGIGTTAVAANATLNAVGSNDLLRSTSSQRYKKDWKNLEDADLDILDTIRTIKYKSLSEQDNPDLIHYGMLAEDVFKLNKNLVTFNTIDVGFDLDVPDWVQYERFIPLLIEQRRRDVKRIEALEAKLGIH